MLRAVAENGGTEQEPARPIQEEQFGESVTPSDWTLYKVFTKKIILVSWTRWRLQQALVWPTVHAFLHLGFWEFFLWLMEAELDHDDEEMPEVWQVMLIIFRTLTPIIMAMTMKTVLDKVVMEMISEKESKMMIVQQVNGLPAWVYWSSYYTYFAATSVLPALVWTITLLCTAFKSCGFVAVFLGIFMNFQHMFFCAVAIQTFFERASTASAMSSVTLMIPLLPIGFGYAGLDSPVYIDVLIFVLGWLPNFNIAFWCQAVLSLAMGDIPWGFTENFFKRAHLPFNTGEFNIGAKELPSPGEIFLVFLAHLLGFVYFSYWFNQVWQGEFGAAKPLCFCCYRARPKCQPTQSAKVSDGLSPTGAAPILELSHLSKEFQSRQRIHKVVDDVTFNVYTGELFALLGHNGAGKTTIINMISGMLPVTSGEIRVMGRNCADDLIFCRQNMSLCPQDNPMYESITVDQHLLFFSALRGSQNQQNEVSQVLDALGISEKRHAKCETLSGGQKRRLWVATSLLGKAPLVFLDEPTSGMDPSSRRELWTLLLDMKSRGRSILFTTHYLEEADLLADRKAVLAKGQVKGIGSSKELKAQCGTGYHLRIMTPRTSTAGNLAKLHEVVTGMVQGATQEQVSHVERSQSSDAPMEVRYSLPTSQLDSFGNLFLAIEEQTDQLQVLDYELATTSLEEVFMKLGKEAEDQSQDMKNSKKNDAQKGDVQILNVKIVGKESENKVADEFQMLDQEQELNANAVSNTDYAKLLWRLRTTQISMNKTVLLGTVAFPLFFTVFSMLHTTVFFSKKRMMQQIYAMYPGLISAVACMRLPYTLIEERERKITQVMLSMGMPRKVYWYTTLGHNSLQVLLVTIWSPILLVLGGDTCLDRGRWIFAVLACLLHFIPLSLFFFVVSCFSQKAENANKFLNLLNVVLGMLVNILPSILWNFELDEMPDIFATVIHNACSFLSPYYLLPGVLTSVWQAGGGDAYKCNRVTDDTPRDHPTFLECFKVPPDAGLGYFMSTWIFWTPWVGQTFLCTVLFSIAYWQNAPKKQSTKVLDDTSPKAKADEDVKAEEDRVRQISPEKEACLYRNLQHVFHDKTRSVHAVRGISLGVQQGECFGLLGPNGAGKTTTLGCLTGEIRPPTAGEVYIAGHSVTGSGAEKAFKQLGFCPQVDPLFQDLTGRQHLLFYGKMKGIANDNLDQVVDSLFQRLGFQVGDRDRRAGTYSGGMKRKLSLAIALIGPSTMLFLDEPSAAVDAGAKRLLWQAIKMRAKSKSLIITTHSMEEAEAVCDRIAIQVLGSIRCLGTPIHLKLKYGSGYQMEIRLKNIPVEDQKKLTGTEDVTKFVKSTLSPEAELLEAHDKCYLYQLPRFKVGGLSLGKVFKGLQDASRVYAIEEYSVVQPSLEQVFLRFAKESQGIVAPVNTSSQSGQRIVSLGS